MPAAAARTILGLVDAQGASGTRSGRSRSWHLVFNLAGWRAPSSSVVIEGRYCALPVSERRLASLMNLLKPYTIVEVEIARRMNDGGTHLRRIVKVGAADPDLRRLASRLRKPIVVEDDTLGRLRYNRKFGWYEGKAEWCGRTIRLCLVCPSPERPEKVLKAARRLLSEQDLWSRQVRDHAAGRYLPLVNRSRVEEGKRALTAEQFLSRIRLLSLDLDESGNITFWHRDGGLLGGHLIQVSGNVSTGPMSIDAPG